MNANGDLGPQGSLATRLIRPTRPARARTLKIPFGRIILTRDRGSATVTGAQYLMSNLSALHRHADGTVEVHNLGSGLVTHAGVRLLSQDTAVSAGAATLNAMKNHGSGTGTTAATATDTALQTAIGTTATAGTNTNSDSSPNALVTAVGTIAYSGTAAVTEWGLFNSTTLAGAVMWDHKTFAAINVVSGDSIQFTYTLTLTSGG